MIKKSGFKMKGPSLIKMVKESAMKMKKAPAKFNDKLKKASEEGKLSGEFKKAVDNAPAKMKKESAMKKYASYEQQKAVYASKADGGKGNPNKMKKAPAKMKKEEPMKMKKAPAKMKKGEPMKLKKESAVKMVKPARKKQTENKIEKIQQPNTKKPAKKSKTTRVVDGGSEMAKKAKASYEKDQAKKKAKADVKAKSEATMKEARAYHEKIRLRKGMTKEKYDKMLRRKQRKAVFGF